MTSERLLHDPVMGYHVVSLGVLMCVLAAPAASQGGLRVRVTDAGVGTPVSGAMLHLPEVSRSGVTDADGTHVFVGLPPGPQHLSVRRLGYAPRVLHVFVGATGTLDLTVVLDVLPARLLPVRVESPPPVEMRDDHDIHSAVGKRVLRRAAIVQMPLLAEPDALLATLGGHVAARPEAPRGLHVMGGASDHLAYRLDGLPVRSPYHAGGTFAGLSPDVLDRVELQTSPAVVPASDALGGVLSWHTRPAPVAPLWTGGVSVTQARLTVERALTQPGSGLLLSGRLLFPGLLGQKREPAHLGGDGSDAVARFITPWWGGTLRALVYHTQSDIALASRLPDAPNADSFPDNDFSWSSNTVGMRWERARHTVALWRSHTRSRVDWQTSPLAQQLANGLTEFGADGVFGRRRGNDEWQVWTQLTHRRSTYVARQGSATDLGTAGWLLAVRPQWSRHAGPSTLTVGAGTWVAGRRVEPAPFAEWTWRPHTNLTVTAEASRRVQFTQSLRNPESIASLLLPADLSVVSGDHVPVARSNEMVVAGAWRPTAAQRVSLRGWWRALEGLALPAIGTDAPFATGRVAEGRGTARGVSVDAAASSTRWGILASYGLQRVRFSARDTTWQPEHGVSHTADAGLIVYAASSASIRLAMSAGAGRRVTGFTGPFEWESCNLRDRGCEFAGTPTRGDATLGGVALPAWARLDVGARKHWHLRTGQRDLLMAVYATWSNALDTRNVLTYATEGSTQRRQAVVMRPSAPLAVGLDWVF